MTERLTHHHCEPEEFEPALTDGFDADGNVVFIYPEDEATPLIEVDLDQKV